MPRSSPAFTLCFSVLGESPLYEAPAGSQLGLPFRVWTTNRSSFLWSASIDSLRGMSELQSERLVSDEALGTTVLTRLDQGLHTPRHPSKTALLHAGRISQTAISFVPLDVQRQCWKSQR